MRPRTLAGELGRVPRRDQLRRPACTSEPRRFHPAFRPAASRTPRGRRAATSSRRSAPTDSPAARTAVRRTHRAPAAGDSSTAIEAAFSRTARPPCVSARGRRRRRPHRRAHRARLPRVGADARDGLRSALPRASCRHRRRRSRLASTPADVAAYAEIAGRAFTHLAIDADITAHDDRQRRDHARATTAPSPSPTSTARRSRARCVVRFDGGRTGYVGWVACLDEARGRGLGDVVTRRVTNEAFARGADLVTLEASQFRRAHLRRGWATARSTATACLIRLLSDDSRSRPRRQRRVGVDRGRRRRRRSARGSASSSCASRTCRCARPWPQLDREADRPATPGDATGPGAPCLVAPPRRPGDVDDARASSVEMVDDHQVVVRYAARSRSRSRAATRRCSSSQMLGDGRVELRGQRGPLWTTMRSYRDGLRDPVPAHAHAVAEPPSAHRAAPFRLRVTG